MSLSALKEKFMIWPYSNILSNIWWRLSHSRCLTYKKNRSNLTNSFWMLIMKPKEWSEVLSWNFKKWPLQWRISLVTPKLIERALHQGCKFASINKASLCTKTSHESILRLSWCQSTGWRLRLKGAKTDLAWNIFQITKVSSGLMDLFKRKIFLSKLSMILIKITKTNLLTQSLIKLMQAANLTKEKLPLMSQTQPNCFQVWLEIA